MTQKPKRPRDANQLAKFVVDLAAGETTDASGPGKGDKDQAAVELGRRGGLKGGKARAAALDPNRRTEIARAAASARWKKSASTE